MSDFIMNRYHQLKEQAVESAFSLPEIFDREYLQRFYSTMIELSKESISLLQANMAYLLRLRDKYPDDLETGELIWFNIQITQECIKQESQVIAALREDLKNVQSFKA